MVSLPLRLFVIALSVVFTVFAIKLITSERLQLRYALLWFLLAFAALLGAIFPEPLFALAGLLGFEQPANFLFFVGLFLILAILLSLSITVSKLSRKVTGLVQENALLRHELESIEHDK